MRMLVLLACLIATSAFAEPVPRAYINNEDSHPHEIFLAELPNFILTC